MSSLTLAIPQDLRSKMRQFPEINWSEVARQAIAQKTLALEQMQRLLNKSELTQADAIEIGREIKRRVAKRHQRAG
jgi:hypothetical protein